jgi:ribosomal protein S27E
MFGKLDLNAEVVNGVCPTCTHPTLLVSITPDHFRCITCGTDLRQHINGKISYIPHVNSPEHIIFEAPKNG